LSQVYQSVQPSSGHGKLIWHSLGAKTIELIHQNVHVDAVRDDLDTLVLDADLLEAVLSNPDPKKAKEIEIKLKRRLRGHGGNPKFKKLSERLDALKDRFESGQINSVEFLKQLLEIAKETLQAEKEVRPKRTRIAARRRSPSCSTRSRPPRRPSWSNAWWPTLTRSCASFVSRAGKDAGRRA
jgi:type I restriction enzyme R subunit